MPQQITDPAGRLNREFAESLEKRYAGYFSTTQVPDFAERYANVCDLIVQLLWPESYGTNPVDRNMHTSATARLLVGLIFSAAGIEPDAQ